MSYLVVEKQSNKGVTLVIVEYNKETCYHVFAAQFFVLIVAGQAQARRDSHAAVESAMVVARWQELEGIHSMISLCFNGELFEE